MTTRQSTIISNHFNKLLFLLLATTTAFLAGCVSSEAPPPPITVTSSNMGAGSLHETGVCTTSACEGRNCQTAGCHGPGDTQNGAFTVSGTVYPYQDLTSAYANSNAVIEFYSAHGGGDASRFFTLAVDKYGNFYTTEQTAPAGKTVYPALYDVDNNRRVFMPRPLVPLAPLSCNYCHGLSDPQQAGTELEVTDLTVNPNPGPPYLRLNNGATSGVGVSITYHSTFGTDPGPNCMQSGCHSDTGTIFSVAGSLTETAATTAYTLADAVIALFPEPCNNPPTCSVTTIDANGNSVTTRDRTKVAKLWLEVDSKGNFYSAIPIDWNTDTYPSLANYDTSPDNENFITCRNVKHMSAFAPSGDCYSCHNGTNQPPISILGELSTDPAEICSQ